MVNKAEPQYPQTLFTCYLIVETTPNSDDLAILLVDATGEILDRITTTRASEELDSWLSGLRRNPDAIYSWGPAGLGLIPGEQRDAQSLFTEKHFPGHAPVSLDDALAHEGLPLKAEVASLDRRAMCVARLMYSFHVLQRVEQYSR